MACSFKKVSAEMSVFYANNARRLLWCYCFHTQCMFILFVLLRRLMEWLQARYAAATQEPVFEENKPTDLTELRVEMMKNKKRIKSIVTMLEAQNKLLRSLALSVNPNFELPEDTEEAIWRKDGTDNKDGRYHSSLETVKELSEEPTDDDTGVDLAAEDKALTDDVFDMYSDM